jgi:PDZ domain-containing protein
VGAVVLLVALVIAALVPVPYEAITPGKGLDIAGMIEVPARVRHHHAGALVLTDVELVPLSALSYLYYLLQSADQVVARSELLGSATSAQYEEQGVIDMGNAQEAAKVVALRLLGYRVKAVPNGVIVYDLLPGSPAATHLRVGDVLTALDGRLVQSVASLEEAIASHQPGRVVTLSGHRYGSDLPVRVRLRLGKVQIAKVPAGLEEECLPASQPTRLGLPPAGFPRACLGISAPSLSSEQSYRLENLPFPVVLKADGIIGPSAGLSLTLGLLEVLSKQDLAAGRRVAATGTMSMTGAVGEVGGIAQKTAAVRAAGASVFLVPSAQASLARAHAGPGLKVLGVSSIHQAIRDLERLGGRLGPLVGQARS